MHRNGFSMIEIMVVLAILAILASMAIPVFQAKFVREQIAEALPLADVVKKPVNLMWEAVQKFPADNISAGLPSPDKIVNNYVKSVLLQDGVIHITFGNRANGLINGKVLTLRPAVVEDAPVVPVVWVCGFAAAPDKMTVKGENKTSIDATNLPLKCR